MFLEQGLIKFNAWMEDLIPRALDLLLEVVFAFVLIIIGVKLIGWVRKLLKKSLFLKSKKTIK
mgnify:CR=1 FL=1